MILSGKPVDLIISFLGGIFMALTPCVYPLIQVTVGYIGAKSGGSRVKGFILSLNYVLGIAVTYSFLGLLASLTGKIFGAVSANPITHIIVGAIIVTLGLSMLDLFAIPVFRFVKLPEAKKNNNFSAFLVGLVSGLVASPCLTPVLGSILAFLTIKKSLAYGTLLLFTFALGMGLPLIVIGTFIASLTGIPKLGRWMDYIKKALAIILIVAGLYLAISAIRRMVI
ncbi:MAG: sulfite exporter TauE/SafE family protein [Candidatus Omnitrophica bacterium]|nr:sulfite exporter TauE/SafE family protein [Candidatus Omnitrophota bacterium]